MRTSCRNTSSSAAASAGLTLTATYARSSLMRYRTGYVPLCLAVHTLIANSAVAFHYS
jgi:hypothetical protein